MLHFLSVVAVAISSFGSGEISGPATAPTGDRLVLEGGRNVRLDGVVAPRRGQYCRRSDDQPYPCGRLAGELLGLLVGGRTVRCTLTGPATGICRVGPLDLGEEMLRRGFAFPPRRGTSRPYARAAAAARAERRGMWQGRFVHPEQWEEDTRNAPPITRTDRSP